MSWVDREMNEWRKDKLSFAVSVCVGCDGVHSGSLTDLNSSLLSLTPSHTYTHSPTGNFAVTMEAISMSPCSDYLKIIR